jgi:hypothetical protein
MMKKRYVVVDAAAVDDEVRTGASWNCVTATTYSEEFFPRTQYMYIQ